MDDEFPNQGGSAVVDCTPDQFMALSDLLASVQRPGSNCMVPNIVGSVPTDVTAFDPSVAASHDAVLAPVHSMSNNLVGRASGKACQAPGKVC